MGDVSDHGILKAVEAAIRDKSMHWFVCLVCAKSPKHVRNVCTSGCTVY